MANQKRDSVANCSAGILLGCLSIWYSCRCSIFPVLSVELGWLAVTSAGCTCGGGSRSCPTQHQRCAILVEGAVKIQGRMFFFVVQRFFVMPLPIARPEPPAAVVLVRGAARASAKAHRRAFAGPVTRKTVDHETGSKLECLLSVV